MALRHLLPELRLGEGLFSGKAAVISRTKPPHAVGFRSGADFRDVFLALEQHNYITLNAAVGSGKSTRLPIAIANELNCLVVQVVPSVYLAHDLAKYVASTGVDCVSVDTVDTAWPDSGVAVVAAGVVVGKWLQQGGLSMPRCVVLHDESHESDAYTYFIKSVWTEVSGILKYVLASASASLDGMRRPEVDGVVTSVKYSVDRTVDTWDVWDTAPDEPWGVGNIVGNTIVFLDDKTQTRRLISDYNLAGFQVFHFHSRMSLSAFSVAAEAMRCSGSKIVVGIADTSFRSGFTFPVAHVIDSGYVSLVEVESGMPIRKIREVYAFEAYQAAGRGGRLAGLTTVCSFPDFQPKALICDLEAVEVEAVALLCRVFGYVVPRLCLDAVMSDGLVPRDLCTALRGATPLALTHKMHLVDLESLATLGGRRSPLLRTDVRLGNADSLDFLNQAVTADVSNRYATTHNDGTKRDSGYDASWNYEERLVAAPIPVQTAASSDSGALGAVESLLAAYAVSAADIEPGSYYHAPSVAHCPERVSAFPDGFTSVCKFLREDKGGVAYLGLSGRNRGSAVNHLVQRFNILSCEFNAMNIALLDAGTIVKERDPMAVKDWVGGFMHRLNAVKAESVVVGRYVAQLADGFCTVELVGGGVLDAQERDYATDMLQGLMCLPRRFVLTTDHHSRVRDGVVGIDVSYSRTLDTGFHWDLDEYQAPTDVIPMPTRGKGMRSAGPGGGTGISETGSSRRRRVSSSRVPSFLGYAAGVPVSGAKRASQIGIHR